MERSTASSKQGILATPHRHAATQERSIKALNAFVANGIKLLNTCRLHELRIPDLCKRSGFSVGTFYLRFPDKEAYFWALQAEVMAQAETLTDERLDPKRLAALTPAQTLDAMVDLMADIFTSPGRAVFRESFLRIQEANEPWAAMRMAGRDVVRRFIEHTADRFTHVPEGTAVERLRFCFQTVVGVLQNELVNDYHVFSTRDGSIRSALKEMLHGYMGLPLDAGN